MLGTYVLSSGYYDAYYKKARAAQRKIREEFANAFEKCDVILTPVAPTTAYEIGSKTTNPLEMYAGDICTVSVNIAGLPGLVQPCGFDENHMPVGMQLIGPRFGEQTLLNAGLAFEQASGLKNIIAHLGTDAFPRVKVGVGAPEHDIVDWVIGPFTANERKVIDGVLDRALSAAECIITDGVSAAQNRYNG